MRSFFAILLGVLIAQAPCEAEVSSDASVHDFTLSGRHFEAVWVAEEQSSALSALEDRLAAARSAWTLGLIDKARSYWDTALGEKNFPPADRHRELLARAIMELQEGNDQRAQALAEESAAELPSSDLRAQFWLVVAEALRSQGALNQAETYYRRVAEEGEEETKSEAMYLLGECQFKLGRVNDSRYSFTSVGTGSHYAARALRRLAEIDLAQKNYDGVLTWIREGRENHAAEFEDPWVGYARLTALSELGQLQEAQEELGHLQARYAEKNPWFVLAEAALEARSLTPAMDSGTTRDK